MTVTGRAEPLALAALVRQRVNGLDPGARQVVQLAAVLGRPFAVEEMLGLRSDEPARTVSDGVDAAVAGGVLVDHGDRISFRHDPVRETVVAALPDHTRRELQRRCAAYLLGADSVLAAAPFVERSARPGDGAAAAILVQAADAATGTDPALAADYASAAFALLRPAQPGWLSTGERCAELLTKAQRGTDALMIIGRILAHTDDHADRARLHGLAARIESLLGRHLDAVTRLDRALTTVQPGSASHDQLTAGRMLVLTRIDGKEASLPRTTALLEQIRDRGDRGARLTAVLACAEAARADGWHAVSLAYYREARVLSGEEHLGWEIRALQLLDRYADADAMLQAARTDGLVLPALMHMQAWQHYDLGRMDLAAVEAEKMTELSRRQGAEWYVLLGLLLTGVVTTVQGDIPRTREILRVVTSDGYDPDLRTPAVALLRGHADLAVGKLREAREVMAPFLYGLADSVNYWAWAPGLMRKFARLGADLGDRRLSEEAATVAEAGADRNPGVASFTGLALLTRAIARSDAALAGRAADVLTDSPLPMLRAAGLEDHGRLLLTVGRRTEGIGRLTAAWQIYRDVGARPAADNAQRLLRRAGVRRAAPVTAAPHTGGLATLSDAEHRVAILIGEGHTNRSAARRLGLSVNTVGSHLRSIFTKLEIQSRVQLANALRDVRFSHEVGRPAEEQ